MIREFKLEIRPEYIVNYNADWYKLTMTIITDENKHGYSRILNIKELQTNSILDIVFEEMKRNLKKALEGL